MVSFDRTLEFARPSVQGAADNEDYTHHTPSAGKSNRKLDHTNRMM
jgi:hypothetical protein